MSLKEWADRISAILQKLHEFHLQDYIEYRNFLSLRQAEMGLDSATAELRWMHLNDPQHIPFFHRIHLHENENPVEFSNFHISAC